MNLDPSKKKLQATQDSVKNATEINLENAKSGLGGDRWMPSAPQIGLAGCEDATTAKKFDQNKPDISLVCPEFILGTADILTFGALKYGKRNYLESKGDQDYYDRLYAALQRHLLAYAAGELLDEESGKPHLFHAAANLAMLTDLGAHRYRE